MANLPKIHLESALCFVQSTSGLARTIHKFSTAATKSFALTALHSVGLLNVLQRVRLRGPLSRVAQRTQAGAFVITHFVTRTYA